MIKNETPRKVAAKQAICGGYARPEGYDQVLNAVGNFNRRLLPLLDELGIDISGNINDYAGLTEEDVFYLYVAKMVSAAGSDYSRKERARDKAKRDFREFMKDRTALSRIDPVNPKYLKYTHWDERAHEFVIDHDSFFSSDNVDIIARTPEELRALELLEAAVDALNALHINQLAGLYINPGVIGLSQFFELEQGKVQIKKAIFPEAWRVLVARTSTK